MAYVRSFGNMVKGGKKEKLSAEEGALLGR
jgi:hypothetical protein